MNTSPNELPAVGPFASMESDDRKLLGSYGEFIPVHPEQILIQEGDLQPNLYCIITGELEVRRTSAEGTFHITPIFPGESVGEMAIFDQTPASATVMAKQFSRVWQISYEQFMTFVEEHPASAVKVLFSLLRTLSRRLRQADPSAFRFSEKLS